MNKKSRIICVIIGLLIVAEVITLTGILYYSPSLVLKRTIKNAVANHESDVIFSLNKIECIADISSADTNQNSKLALLSGTNGNNENCYGIVAVNSENKTIEDIYFGTTELQIFMAHIFINEDYTVNMANFENVFKYVSLYGTNCFTLKDEDNKFPWAEQYIRQDICSGSMLSLDKARKIMANYINSENECNGILFEADNAYPLFYFTEKTELRYMWTDYPEAFLSALDRDSKAAFNYMYGGPAYREYTVYRIYDVNTKKQSGYKFDSIDELDNYCQKNNYYLYAE